jgi:hypothetical protein
MSESLEKNIFSFYETNNQVNTNNKGSQPTKIKGLTLLELQSAKANFITDY